MLSKVCSLAQKQSSVEVCEDLVENATNDDIFLKNIITHDKTWL